MRDPLMTPVRVFADRLAPPSDAPFKIVPLRLNVDRFLFERFALVRSAPGPTR